MLASVRCRVDGTAASRERFRRRLARCTDLTLDSETPVVWCVRFDGGTGIRRRYCWELRLDDVNRERAPVATVVGVVPRLALRRSRLAIDSAVPGFAWMLADALRSPALRPQIARRHVTLDRGVVERISAPNDGVRWRDARPVARERPGELVDA